MTTTVSEKVSKAMSGVMRTPATAAMAEPTIHDAAVTRFTLMPHSRAVSGLSATARMALPSVV